MKTVLEKYKVVESLRSYFLELHRETETKIFTIGSEEKKEKEEL